MISYVAWSLLLLCGIFPVVKGTTLCINKDTEPGFHPNIYTCNETASCCETFDETGCCSNVIPPSFIAKLLEFCPYALACFFLTSMVAINLLDPDPFDTVKFEAENNNRTLSKNVITDDTRVKDPLFGAVMWDVAPTYASYEEQRPIDLWNAQPEQRPRTDSFF
uniref:Uncharacterized protein n=1 Tax=Steinernema glaseri TaxID=37863 RepID=A0A1I7ZKX5_9BILA